MSIDDLAARQRNEAIAKAKRLAQQRGDRTQFFSGGGVFSAGEPNQPATTGSNGPIRKGQPTPILQAGGITQYDAPSRSEPEGPLNPVQPRGDVAVLASVQVADGTWQVWLGGDRVMPIPVMVGLQNSPSASLDLLGPGKNDWVVGIGWRQGTTLGSYAIAMRYGKQDPDQQREDWQILDNPHCQFLRYYGDSFWASSVLNYSFDFYATIEQNTPIPDSDNPPPGLAIAVRSGYHAQTGGESTHSQEYYENVALVNGATSASVQGGKIESGFVPQTDPTDPIQFTGTNRKQGIRVVTATWEGTASGPGYLGPGGQPCNGSETILGGTANFPRRAQTALYESSVDFATQAYSFYAYEGVLHQSTGSHNYQSKSEQLRSIHVNTYFDFKRLNYITGCYEYSSPTAFLWGIFIESSEVWPFIPNTNTIIPYPIISGLSNQVRLHPTLERTHKYNALAAAEGGGLIAQAEYFGTVACIPRATDSRSVVWSEYKNSGQCAINRNTNGRPSFYDNSTATSKSFLLWEGTQLELQTNWNTYRVVWQSKPESPYPVGYYPENPPYTRKPDLSFDPDEFNVFKKPKVKFLITKYLGRLVGGKLAFDGAVQPQLKKALGMKKLSAIAKPGTSPSVADIRYWAKS